MRSICLRDSGAVAPSALILPRWLVRVDQSLPHISTGCRAKATFCRETVNRFFRIFEDVYKIF